ncbi:thiol:disulfide interchange protein DsbG [Pseudomonas sp. JUb42]|jgi:thiol:disulfide interchange protein DsbG|uniref:thiol:disulfide interchange protein DsbG n=1 Tax=Pseudomonas sp. JUb42 TaxID=2940611 RepID=UPI00216A7A85|nr:thiol:disulfide interchange protein DsbG [Pseudomonas sp. JUb42]MCS3466878.1 thiol:disulfide interchange protein DsbG [Pseudomonas sp. JUb42]
MTLTRILSTLALAAITLQSPLLRAAEELPAPIKALQAKGAHIVSSFDAPGGLRGYAAEYNKQAIALYLTADGEHVLAGNLYDAKGQDLSRAPLEKLVYEPMSKEIWAKLEKTTWIADGSQTAPKIVYLFSDANCPYCNMFWEQARPWVKAGKVQLRHIMVGIIREDSAAKAAALLADKNPEVALTKHEAAGRGSTLKPLAKIPADIQAKLDGNMELMNQMGLSATPSIFYLDDKGQMQQIQGAPQGKALEEMLGPKP